MARPPRPTRTRRASPAQELLRTALGDLRHESGVIYDESPLLLVVVDNERRICRTNRAVQAFTQRTGRELLLQRPGEALRCVHALESPRGCGTSPDCQHCRIRQAIADTFSTGASHRGIEVSLYSQFPDGLHKLTLLASTTRLDSRRQPHVLLTLQDVTARAEAEAGLRASQKELTDFFNSSPLGLLQVTAKGVIARSNRAQSQLLGYAENELAGVHVARLHVEREAADDILDRLAAGESVRDYRAAWRRKDGEVAHVLINANGFWDKGWLLDSRWFVRDITPRVELESEILAISEREQRRLGNDLHDDLCQQLVGIEFLSQTLARNLASRSKSLEGQARDIAEIVRRVIEQTREMARGLSPVVLEAEGLMTALKALAARTSRVFRVECRFHCATPVLIPDHVMAIHLYRIAQESVSNAIRHGQAQRVEICLSRGETGITLAVNDNGLGLPARPQPQAGMGLHIMRYRAGVIGGLLTVRRLDGGGTGVCCTAPANLPAPELKPAP